MNQTLSLALAKSLLSDSFYSAITIDFAHDEAKRLEVLAAYVAYSLAEAAKIGLLVENDKAAAAWILPMSVQEEHEASAQKQAFLKQKLGAKGKQHYDAIVEFMSPRAPLVVADGAWYLSILAVAPEAQNQGIGARLLAPTLQQADDAGRACYIETFVARNMSFYERLGFVEVARHFEPTTQVDYMIMLRQPKLA